MILLNWNIIMLIKNEQTQMSLKIFNLILSGEAFRLFFYIFPEKEIKDDELLEVADICFSESFPNSTDEYLLKKLEATFGEMERVRLINMVRDGQGKRLEISINHDSEWVRKNEIDPINLSMEF